MRKFFSLLAVIGAFVMLPITAQAGFLASTYVSNQDNVYEDQDREALIDVNANNTFDVGDVLLGWARIDDNTSPGGFGPLGNRVYGIFSQQVADVNTTGATHEVIFAPTTVAGLTLSEILDTAVPAGGMFAVLSEAAGFSHDLVNASPGDITTGGLPTYPGAPANGTTNMWDYLGNIISNGGTLDFVSGIGNVGGAVATTALDAPIALAAFTPLPDHFIARTTPTGSGLITGATLAGLPTIPSGVTVANFTAGLSILLNNDPLVTYNRVVAATETFFAPDGAGGFVRHDLAIVAGNANGTMGVARASEWDNVNPDTVLSNPGGFVTNADFVVNPTVVPEPISAAVWSVVGMGLLAMRRRNKRIAAKNC
jgi:hypothetical protein